MPLLTRNWRRPSRKESLTGRRWSVASRYVVINCWNRDSRGRFAGLGVFSSPHPFSLSLSLSLSRSVFPSRLSRSWNFDYRESLFSFSFFLRGQREWDEPRAIRIRTGIVRMLSFGRRKVMLRCTDIIENYTLYSFTELFIWTRKAFNFGTCRCKNIIIACACCSVPQDDSCTTNS